MYSYDYMHDYCLVALNPSYELRTRTLALTSKSHVSTLAVRPRRDVICYHATIHFISDVDIRNYAVHRRDACGNVSCREGSRSTTQTCYNIRLDYLAGKPTLECLCCQRS
jgi:hypothetical protein